MSFINYKASTLPSGREPSSSQLDLMDESWVQTDVTKTDTEGTVGMFGYENDDNNDCPWG